MLTDGLWRTTTFRLTLLFGVVFAAGIGLLLGLVYLQTAGYLVRRVDQQLSDEAGLLRREQPETILAGVRREITHDPLNSFGLYAATGERVAGNIQLGAADLPVDGRPQEVPGRFAGGPARALATRLPWGEVLVIARDTRQIEEFRRIVLNALLVSGGLIAVLGAACGVALSRRPLRRIQAMHAAADRITAGDFAVRLPRGDRADELDQLAGIANRMMDEAERLMFQARSVGEGVAHELRTPLTRLRATLDHAAQGLDPDDPRRRLLDPCIAEADAMLSRFRALLRIAAVEARGRRVGIGPVSLSALVDQVAELYEPLAADRAVALTVEREPDVVVRADGDLLFEALSNLIDNALKFTPSGGRVRLRLTRPPGGGVVVEVTDSGPGIPETERSLVTQRFYRGARHAQVEGHGLGLSLVAAVAELHGFILDFQDAAPGTTVRLMAPPGP